MNSVASGRPHIFCKIAVVEFSYICQENICEEIHFLVELQAYNLNIYRKVILFPLFFSEFHKFFENSYLKDTSMWLPLCNPNDPNCSKSRIKTLEKGVKDVEVNNKDIRTASLSSFWYFFTVNFKHIPHLLWCWDRFGFIANFEHFFTHFPGVSMLTLSMHLFARILKLGLNTLIGSIGSVI